MRNGTKKFVTQLFPLHPVAVDQLRLLLGSDPCVFPWNHDEGTLYHEFARIQKAGGIDLLCKVRGEHEHNRRCYL